MHLYDSRFDDDFICRGTRSRYHKGIIEGVPGISTLFGYDTFRVKQEVGISLLFTNLSDQRSKCSVWICTGFYYEN